MSDAEQARELADCLGRITADLASAAKGQTWLVDRANILWDIRNRTDRVAGWLERRRTVPVAESFRARIDTILALANKFADALSYTASGSRYDTDKLIRAALYYGSTGKFNPDGESDANTAFIQLMFEARTAAEYVRAWAKDMAAEEERCEPTKSGGVGAARDGMSENAAAAGVQQRLIRLLSETAERLRGLAKLDSKTHPITASGEAGQHVAEICDQLEHNGYVGVARELRRKSTSVLQAATTITVPSMCDGDGDGDEIRKLAAHFGVPAVLDSEALHSFGYAYLGALVQMADYVEGVCADVERNLPAGSGKAKPSVSHNSDCAGYVPAGTLGVEHGIQPQRLSEAARDGRVKTRPAPKGYTGIDGTRVRVLYHEKQAIKHCIPKKRRKPKKR